MHQTMNAKVSQAYARATGDIKGRLDGHYQHEGVKWMLQREFGNDPKGGILADDMGLGKTMQTIATIRGNPQTTLIITIVSTVAQWRDALIQFGGMTPIIVNPSFKGILPALDDNTVVLTTYSAFQAKTPPACFNIDWGRIILDEGHTIRNPTCKTNKEITRLNAGIRWILSGTPMQNGTKDILALAQWVGWGGQDIEEITSSLVLRRTQAEQAALNPRLALPPLETKVVVLEFASEDERDFYRDVDEYYYTLAASQSSKTMVMEAILRCRQAATHPRLFIESQGGKKRKRMDPSLLVMPGTTTKFTYLLNDIGEVHATTKEKVLVFCTWTREMKLLQEGLTEKNIACLIYDGNLSRDNKEAVLYNFKHTNIRVLLLQITCGNAGLNLQEGSRVYITSPQWNPCIELQALGRAYRKGQTQKVTCIRLVLGDTIEERCGDVQLLKLEQIRDVMADESMIERLGEEGNMG
jgi:SNF2 family DNA or RNA helicase